jgi:ubiquinone biosynthesis protein
MLVFPLRGRRHWRRYREIALVLLGHGFDQIIDILELTPFVYLPARLLRRWRPTEEWTAPQRLRHAIEQLGPTFVKLGQILSTRADLLPPDYLAELALLQDRVPPFPAAQARALIEAELGKPITSVFATFDDVPIAAASLAQVHRAVLLTGERVVTKVQRPSIETRVNTDLEILFDLAGLAQARTPLGQIYDLTDIAEDFALLLRDEMDYEREADNIGRFQRYFADDPGVVIPRVYYATRRLLVLEELEGIKIDDVAALEAAQVDRHQVALESARLIIKQVFDFNLFHADPHPGNFYVLPPAAPGGPPRIGAMDFGMVGAIDPHTRETLLRLMLALVRREPDAIVDELLRMGAVNWERLDRRRLQNDIRRLMSRYWGRPIREWRARDMMNDLTPITFRHHVHFPTELWLLAKVLVMSEGVATRLDPEFDLFSVGEPYARRLYAETISPAAVGRRALEGLGEWSEELLVFPQQLRHIVERIERGNLQVMVRSDSLSAHVNRLDRMASRLAASVLIAAFIVSVSLLVPLITSDAWRALAIALIALALLNAAGLALWLAVSTWPWRK